MRVESHFQPHTVINMELFSTPNISETKTSKVKEYNWVLFFSIFGTELLVQGLSLDNFFYRIYSVKIHNLGLHINTSKCQQL